jgi:hypothetical protein
LPDVKVLAGFRSFTEFVRFDFFGNPPGDRLLWDIDRCGNVLLRQAVQPQVPSLSLRGFLLALASFLRPFLDLGLADRENARDLSDALGLALLFRRCS